MAKKTYIDECLERAEKATEGKWKIVDTSWEPFTRGIAVKAPDGLENGITYVNRHKNIVNSADNKLDLEFIANARTDVPELARRLKGACEFLRVMSKQPSLDGYALSFLVLADELERMPESKE